MRIRSVAAGFLLLLLPILAPAAAHADRGRIRVAAPPEDRGPSATRVAGHDRFDPAGENSQNEAEIAGTVASIDCGSNTMTVTTSAGDVVVAFDAFTVFRQHGDPASCSGIQTGDAVEVSGTAQGDGSILAAKVSFEAPDAAETEISGTVASIDCGAGTMVVTTGAGDVAVALDPSTIFRKQGNPAACADVHTGDTVEVSGTAQGDGSVLAAKVTIESAETEDTEISGIVASIDCVGNSMVVTTSSGDVTVTFDPSTAFVRQGDPAACADVQVGDAVEVSGVAQGDGSIAASRVSFEAPETEDAEISGTVASIDCGASSMVVTTESGDVTVGFDGNTEFSGNDHAAAVCADIVPGDSVEVSGALQGDGSILASKVSFEAPEIEDTEVKGTILSTDSGAQTFLLAGEGGSVTIAVDSNTVIRNDGDVKTFADLAPGMAVEVKGIVQGDGSILASEISIESGD